MISIQPAEYFATETAILQDVMEVYQRLYGIVGFNPQRFPIDKTVTNLRLGNDKTRFEMIYGQNIIILEKRNDGRLFVRDLNLDNGATGTEEIYMPCGTYTKTNIKVERSKDGTVRYSSFGEPIAHEQNLVDFCNGQIVNADELLDDLEDLFIVVTIEKNSGKISIQGMQRPELLAAFIKVMGVDPLVYKPNTTTLTFASTDDGRIASMLSAEFSANVEIVAENGVTLSWQGPQSSRAKHYSFLDGTLSIANGHFARTSEGMGFCGEIESEEVLPHSSNDDRILSAVLLPRYFIGA